MQGAQSYDLGLSNTAAPINDYINTNPALITTHLRVSQSNLLWQITEWLRWTGTFGSIWSHPCSSRRHPEQVGTHVLREEAPQALGSLYQCLVTCTVTQLFHSWHHPVITSMTVMQVSASFLKDLTEEYSSLHFDLYHTDCSVLLNLSSTCTPSPFL